jgi:anti-sigma factor RsiW
VTAQWEEHCELALVPYLRGELAADERELVDRHLGACAGCREALEGFRAVLAGLRTEPHEPPEVDWRRYRAELRAKREASSDVRGSTWAIPRLVPVFATAAIAGLALFFTLRGTIGREGPGDELPIFEQTALGSRLDLLKDYDVVENLDLLEDLDLVQDLDDVAPVEQG